MEEVMAGIALALALTLAGSSAIARTPQGYDFSAVNAELTRQCISGEFSGIVVVRVRGRELYAKDCGWADMANLVPIERGTRFRIFSTSKLLTALTVMRLVEQGKMGLDNSVADYLPDVPKEWRAVSLRSLLNHTSGIPDYTELLLYHFRSDHPTAMKDTLAALTPEQRALATRPGERFSYNNFGFELIADAAAHVTGKPFGQVVKEVVLVPAGMKNASVEAPNMVAGHPLTVAEDGLANGYNGSPDKLEQAAPWSFVQLGAGAVRASVDDFVALDEAISAGKIVTPQTWALMTSNPVTPPPGAREGTDNSFGLGVNLEEHDGVRLQGHKGGTNGYISAFERFPDDGAMMIVLANRGFTATKWLREGVAKTLKEARQQ